MSTRYWIFRRKGVFYYEDTYSRKQFSLRTRDRLEAETLLAAKQEAACQPQLNLQMARVYLSASDPVASTRTWGEVIETIIDMKDGETYRRWRVAAKDKAFAELEKLKLLDTRAEHFLRVLKRGTVSTNVYLRRIHNFAMDMAWVPAPIIPRRQWPKVQHGEKRAINWDEHLRIVDREPNPERQAFYELAWHLGASQGDLAHLHAEDIDWSTKTICFERMKLRGRGLKPPLIAFGPSAEIVLSKLPKTGPLFPYLIGLRPADRATEFKQRLNGLGIKGVTLHSYRYSWAERAKQCAFPERYAQTALGHNSKAVHRAYARRADVTVPALESFEREMKSRIIAFTAVADAKDKRELSLATGN
jgi:integrase